MMTRLKDLARATVRVCEARERVLASVAAFVAPRGATPQAVHEAMLTQINDVHVAMLSLISAECAYAEIVAALKAQED